MDTDPRHLLDELRPPFTPDAIRWKVQSTWGPKDGARTGGMVVPYVDARTVIARLDHVAGMDWSDETVHVDGTQYAMTCDLTIGETVRSDVGESTHSLKAAASDALKRAAVRFGVGASIYAMNRVMLSASSHGNMEGKRPTLKQKKAKGKDTLELTPDTETWLREKYGMWIKTQDFGEPLSHGDTPETLGLEGAEQRPPDPDEDALADDVAQLRLQYEEMTPAQRKGLSKAKFNAQLNAASESKDALDQLGAELNERTKE